MIVGLVVAALGTWAFLALADEFPEKGGLARLDLTVTNWLQAHGTERGESIFWTVSLFGSPVLYAIAIAVAIYFIRRRDWRHLGVLAASYGGGALLNTILKLVFHRARPAAAIEFVQGSWSFPSGHAMDSLIVYGMLAYWIAEKRPGLRTRVIAIAAAAVILIGFSRVYLGVHYVSDVLAGYSAGSVWLAVCITAYRFTERRGVGNAGADEKH